MPGKAPPLRFEILGRLAARRDGQELDLGPGKQQAVLAVLLLTPNRPVSTAAIVDSVWGEDPPDNGANVVQKYVAGLRRVLEPDRSPRTPGQLLTLTGAGYTLNVPPGGLDAEVFQERVKAALAVRGAGDAAEAAGMLREALAMWRGTALAGLNGPVFGAARERLEEEHAAAWEAWAEIGLELGRHAALVPELIRLVADFPLREGFRYLLMLALYRCGRQAEALAAYRDARAFLDEEFGVEPGERLRSLQVSILRSDPALAAPSERATERAAPAERTMERAAPAERTAERAAPAERAAERAAPATRAVVHDLPSPLEPVAGVPPTAAARPAFSPAAQVGEGVPAAGGPVMWTAPAPAPAPAPRRLPWPVRGALAMLPLLSLGTVTWALISYFAARRGSRALGLAAAAYFAMAAVFLGVASVTGDQTTWWDIPVMASLLATMFGGAVHLAVLTAEPGPSARPAGDPNTVTVPLIERRVRREQARSLAVHHPSVARRLGVGRPDLPRTFDDGGLVDVNEVPEHLLAALPGLDPYHAKLIVAVREAQGPYASIDDLVTRGVLPAQVVRALYETLVLIPPDTEPDAS